MRPEVDDVRCGLESLRELYLAGVPIDWQAGPRRGRPVALPTYPFARRRYWIGDPPGA